MFLGVRSRQQKSGREKNKTWDEQFGLLKAYKEMHGNCKVPRSSKNLRNWLDRQKHSKKKGKLSQPRIELLSSIGFDFNTTKIRTKENKTSDEQCKIKTTKVGTRKIRLRMHNVRSRQQKSGQKKIRLGMNTLDY